MFANKIVLDEYGHEDTEIELSERTDVTEVVRRAIDGLNGRDRTLVTAEARSDSHCAVGGSSAEGLVLYCTFDNLEFHQLVNPQVSGDGVVTVVAGGQPGDFPTNHVVTPDAAVQAMVEFATTGKLAGGCSGCRPDRQLNEPQPAVADATAGRLSMPSGGKQPCRRCAVEHDARRPGCRAAPTPSVGQIL